MPFCFFDASVAPCAPPLPSQTRKLRIATCPLVEDSVVRILNLPGDSKSGPAGFEAVSSKLQQICTDLDHAFWPDVLSLRSDGLVNWSRVLGHNQITDVYLVALALAHQGCLVTLDHRVALGRGRTIRSWWL